MTISVASALTDFYQAYAALCQQQAIKPAQVFDPEWDSACFLAESEERDGEMQRLWQPVKREDGVNFGNIETALEISLDKQIDPFFGSYYSDHVSADFNGETITLVQVWNDDDFIGLQENMIAHLLMKKKLKQSPTLFIATCVDEMEIIAIDNTSGEVVKERLGKGISSVLAADLVDFISQLTPVINDEFMA